MQEKVKYYFLIASDKFLLKDEPLEEILRERVHYYVNTKKYIDFWIIPSPQFLFSSEIKDFKKTYPENCFSIVSTNKHFITWLKLRLNNVWTGKFMGPSQNILSPLKSKNLKRLI